ncbi:hypothetical protein DFH06DRAFT_1234544 [Mycena polygramma]|nr:hypothetical protein DFH06DRAFT_1234544 [Mycena polygramma]
MLVHGGRNDYYPKLSFTATVRASASPPVANNAVAKAPPLIEAVKPGDVATPTAVDTGAFGVAQEEIENAEKVLADKIEDEAEKVLAQADVFHQNKPYSPTLKLNVQPEVWTAIKHKCENQSNYYKLEYVGSSETLMVTWATTWVHESFDGVLDPFKKIASLEPQRYRCLFNKNITVVESQTSKADLTPDFSLSRRAGSGWEHLIILECAASQTNESLMEKVQLWLKQPTVRLVIAVGIEIDNYQAPVGPLPKRADLATAPTAGALLGKDNPTLEDFRALPCPPLGPIAVYGHQWGRKIHGITVGLYGPPEGEEDGLDLSFDITPCTEDSPLPEQERVTDALEILDSVIEDLTREVVGPSSFDIWFPKSSFRLGWRDFPVKLGLALRDDAFDRFSSHFQFSPPVEAPSDRATFRRVVSRLDQDKLARACSKRQRLA